MLAEVALELTLLRRFQLLSLLLHLLSARVGEVLVSFLVLGIFALLFLLGILILLGIVGLEEVDLHEALDLVLLLSVLPELLLHELREFLLLSDLHVAIEGVKATLLFDLVHVQVEDVTVTNHVVSHKDSLPELLLGQRGVNEGKPSLSGDGRHVRVVAIVSHALELLSLLWVRV